MSARDDLIALIEDKCRAIGHEPDIHVDAFAHELAEKIRLYKDEARGAVQATRVVDFCADLIDPATNGD